MVYLTPEERMKVSLRRHEVEATGKPFYKSYDEVPGGYISKTQAAKMKMPVERNEEPAAYVLNRNWNGYMPLYFRELKEEER